MGKSERNLVLDEVKAIACIFVILIHCKFPGVPGDICEALARFGVPMFFTISGRYLLTHSEADASAIRKTVVPKIINIAKTTLFVLFFYTVYSLWYCLDAGYSFTDWVSEKYNAFEFSRLILFNSGKFIYDFSYAYDHIWFLLALLYVYILVYIFAGKVRKWALPLTFILLAFLFFGEMLQSYYPIRPFGISVSVWYVIRNWLFVGIPFTMLGVWFGDNGRDIILLQSASVDIIIIIAGMVFTVVEYFIWGSREVYLGSVILVIGALYLAESIYVTKKNILSFIGENLSASVYYMHVFVISFLGWIIDHTADFLYANAIFMYLRPIIVIAVTLVISLLMYFISCNRIKRIN